MSYGNIIKLAEEKEKECCEYMCVAIGICVPVVQQSLKKRGGKVSLDKSKDAY